jgi:hypothetical protein
MEKVLVIELKYSDLLGAIRSIPGLKVATEDNVIWLRGIKIESESDKLTCSLPVLHAYTLGQDGLLFPAGKRTPTKKLPELSWQPIRQFISVKLPISAMPGKLTTSMPVTLKRSVIVKESFALKISLTKWKIYAETAPQTRLNQLRFAVSAKAEVLVYGNPLPNLPGKTYWLSGNILLPAGHDFAPPVISNLIATEQQHEQQKFMLFEPDGNWQEVPLSAFQPAKRSAIRLTCIEHE